MLCKELYLTFEWKTSFSLCYCLRNEVPSHTRICFWYTFPCWFRHEESWDSDWKQFLFPTLNVLWTCIHSLACLLSFQGQILDCSVFHSVQANNRLIPEGVSVWSQRYFWCRFGGDVLWMVLWYCLGAAREWDVASWAQLREFLVWEVGHAKQQKSVSKHPGRITALRCVFSPQDLGYDPVCHEGTTTSD